MSAKTHRFLSRLPLYTRCFADAWLLMDRDNQADDNAEHLYRYIRRHQPHVNAWFVLRKRSLDWYRLKNEGFRLLALGSWRHKMALLNARHVVSSHTEKYTIDYLPARYYRGLAGWEFTFLQHGVIHNDLSAWLNNYSIRHFVTSGQPEYAAISAESSNYKFTKREVALTGMPRHDRLYEQGQRPPGKTILIMPTWRKNLVGMAREDSNQRDNNPAFVATEFFRRWLALLESSKLSCLARKHGYEIVFFPHANLGPYLGDFRRGPVRVLGHADVDSIQDLMLRAAVLITDYSSVAFEMAYIMRPILYYQFDEERIYSGVHIGEKGYFDYTRDGFGPVCKDLNSLLESLESVLKHECQVVEPYRQRMARFFVFRDGRCCERVFNVIANNK